MAVLSVSFVTYSWDSTATAATVVTSLDLPLYTANTPVSFSISTDVIYSGTMEDGSDFYLYDAIGKKTATLKGIMNDSQLQALLSLIPLSYNSTAYDWDDTGWQYVSLIIRVDNEEYSQAVSSIARGVFSDMRYSPRGVDKFTNEVYWDVSFSFREVDS